MPKSQLVEYKEPWRDEYYIIEIKIANMTGEKEI